jgi:hypothetical protein
LTRESALGDTARRAGGSGVKDRWLLRGPQFGNCNCAYGCPCQFGSPTTNGFCHALGAVRVNEGYFNDVRLDGLAFVFLLQWPGEIAQGNGRGQANHRRAREHRAARALGRILRGESTAPGATHFYVFASTLRETLETIYAPVECEIDVDRRTARVSAPDLIDSRGTPIVDPHSGQEFPRRDQPAERLRVHLRRDGQRHHERARRPRVRAQGQLRAVPRAAHEPGRRDPLTRLDRIAILSALAAATALAWWYTARCRAWAT